MAFESMYLEEDIQSTILNTKAIFTLQENAIISGNFNV